MSNRHLEYGVGANAQEMIMRSKGIGKIDGMGGGCCCWTYNSWEYLNNTMKYAKILINLKDQW